MSIGDMLQNFQRSYVAVGIDLEMLRNKSSKLRKGKENNIIIVSDFTKGLARPSTFPFASLCNNWILPCCCCLQALFLAYTA
jgi:hypothetical protein